MTWCGGCSSFNTQPPEGGWRRPYSATGRPSRIRCFNTQPPEGGWHCLSIKRGSMTLFQHTAARRRLGYFSCLVVGFARRFNTQPPEGGWVPYFSLGIVLIEFQHTAARRRLDIAQST